jgi:hypothetical protein
MVKRTLTENNFEALKTRYNTIVSYPLYLRYLDYRAKVDASAVSKEDAPRIEDNRNEINRVGSSMPTIMP